MCSKILSLAWNSWLVLLSKWLPSSSPSHASLWPGQALSKDWHPTPPSYPAWLVTPEDMHAHLLLTQTFSSLWDFSVIKLVNICEIMEVHILPIAQWCSPGDYLEKFPLYLVFLPGDLLLLGCHLLHCTRTQKDSWKTQVIFCHSISNKISQKTDASTC